MRSLRLLTVAGLAVVACALPAQATACELTGFGASPDVVRPGDPVTFTILTRSTERSPGSSPYVVDAGGREVAGGTVTPDPGGEGLATGSFPMPDFGAVSGPITVTVRLTDSGDYKPASVQYDGTPAAAAAPPSPAPTSTPVAAAEHAPTLRARSRVHAEHVPPARPAHRVRPTRTRSRTPVAAPPRRPAATAPPSRVATPQRISTPRPVSAAVPQGRPHAAHARRTRATAHRTRETARRFEPLSNPPPVAVVAQPARTASPARDQPPTLVVAGLASIAVLVGGAGAALLLRRRRNRRPDDDEPLDVAIEAELQSLLLEETRGSGAADSGDRAPA